ncbi:BTAD domain-containing putative transcriptional regulator [Saccharothrix yanglingensis]|uniref:Transcriptional regulator n=1 Tax=Saccharothrix yanglingensis TaxID=659496 RepID=A0ABU0X7Z9_9PSEU|nr:BTAD domain-containing putative transcriptional regulator [Saccharothrix yanglingensis]MDQ2588096.1 transcriptional regulator [Saccharothrix yanglingensis]
MTGPEDAVRVELLGPVRAWVGQLAVDLGSSRPRTVFAVLASRPDVVVPRDELVGGVWGEAAPANAVGNLHTHISALRKALEPGRDRNAPWRLLTSTGSGYRLHVDPAAVDAVEFTRLAELARGRFAAADAGGALHTATAALDLWRGEVMSGLSGPLVLARRSRLGELRAATVELLAEAGLAIGDHAGLADRLGALVAEHPLRERPRELLMRVLRAGGRNAEALDVYHDVRRLLLDEQGIEPGAGLRRLRDEVLADTVAPRRPAVTPGPETPTAETPAAAPTNPVAAGPTATRFAPPALAGRSAELAVVDGVVRRLASGHGGRLWIEGEMGIGKSALLTATLARAGELGCRIAHAVAEELDRRFPLGAALDCLDVTARSAEPRRAAIWTALRGTRPHRQVPGSGDPVAGAIDDMVSLVADLCEDGPVVLALDDVQWADDASVALWHRLCPLTARLPLLLVGAARPLPHREDVHRLRRDVGTPGGAVVELTPLDEHAVAGMIARLVGARPGPGLRRVAERAAGNPLYVREIADALVRDKVVRLGQDTADVPSGSFDRVPRSLVSAVTNRLHYLADATREVLRWAALIGGEFAADDLAAVLGRPAGELAAPLDEAVTAGVLRAAGRRWAFRHPVIRQALYEGTPLALRVALHQQAARALAGSGAPVEHVAAQLLAGGGSAAWVGDWLVEVAPLLTHRAPLVAVELLRREVDPDVDFGDRARGAVLTARLAVVLFRVGRDAEAEACARRALPLLHDEDLAAQTRWVLAYVPYRASRAEEALEILDDALADPALPPVWRARLMSLLALVQRAGIGEVERAADTARDAVALGEASGDPFSIGQALEVLWQVDAVRRDYSAAVAYLDRALAVVGTDLDLSDLRLVLLDNRSFTLQCLDRLDDATADLGLAAEIAGRGAPAAGVQVAGAVHDFWLGRWDDAVARLDGVLDDPAFTGFGLREGGPVLLLHGVGALVAAHRDDDEALERHLRAGLTLPLATAADRENCDFLVAARAMACARRGDVDGAMALLGTILDARYAQMMLRHQWLPDLVRLALDRGDEATARAAAEACEAEAARETRPARADAAARRCRALLDGDADAMAEVVARYRAVGRVFEHAQAAEDHAVLLLAAGRAEEAATALREATDLYRGMGTHWDVRRAAARADGVRLRA